MASPPTQATYLPLVEQDFPQEHAALAQAFQTRASWAWTQESREYEPPNAPGEQRGFRWTYTSTLPTRTPSSLTIILSVDNYFALHVNGAVVHVANPDDDLWDAFAFTVPVPAGTNRAVVALRGINAEGSAPALRNPAGFTAAIKVSYQGTTDTETMRGRSLSFCSSLLSHTVSTPLRTFRPQPADTVPGTRLRSYLIR